jgi:probable rRNA maturation factor
VIEVEVIGLEGLDGTLGPVEVEQLCDLALASAGIDHGHLAVEFVSSQRIRELNRDHRGVDAPTDVLSFGVDEDTGAPEPREMGDVVISAADTEDLHEAILHGALHLTGMDHEADEGEMIAVQQEILDWVRQPPGTGPAGTP